MLPPPIFKERPFCLMGIDGGHHPRRRRPIKQMNELMRMDFVPNSHGRNNPPIAFADRKSISKASPIRHLGLRIRMMDEWKKGGI